MAVKTWLVFLFMILAISFKSYAQDDLEVKTLPPPQNFYIKSVTLQNGQTAYDFYQTVQGAIPSDCKLKHVIDNNADFIVTGKLETVETSPIYKNVNKLFIRVSVKAMRSANNELIAEIPEKHIVLEANENEQKKVYKIASELMENAASEVFSRICGLAKTND